MRILLLTQWFDPEPFFKGLSFARALRERGHHVEVLTGFPNYPGGKLYDGYALGLRAVETLDGFRVNRVWLFPSHDRSTVRRVANYLSFATTATLLGGIVALRPDVIYAYQPPATIGVPAMVLGARWKVPYVLDVQDLWPDTVAASGMLSNPVALRILDRLCFQIYRRAERVTVLSEGFKRALVQRGVEERRLVVIRNWCDEQGLKSRHSDVVELADPEARGQFVVVFAGTLGYAQDLDSVLAAARLCESMIPHARFVIAGDGTELDRLRSAAADLRNVSFLGRLPMSSMERLFAAADALLVHLRDQPLFSVTIPSKTQAYLAAGRPIIMGVRGDAADLVREARAGIVVTPGDPVAIARGVMTLAEMKPGERAGMGASGREFYWRNLSQRAGVETFERVFEDAIRSFR